MVAFLARFVDDRPARCFFDRLVSFRLSLPLSWLGVVRGRGGDVPHVAALGGAKGRGGSRPHLRDSAVRPRPLLPVRRD